MRTDLWLKLFGRTQALAARRRMRRARARTTVERFESRTLLAGVVSMEINGEGNLVITGDDSGNEFLVTQAGDTFTISDPEDFDFDTGGETLFDVGGGPVSGPVSVTGTVNDVFISVGGANDFVTLVELNVGNIEVNGGTGHNEFLLKDSIANGDVTITNGDGGDFTQTVVELDDEEEITTITQGFFGGETDFEGSVITGNWSESNRGAGGTVRGRVRGGNIEALVESSAFSAVLSVNTEGDRQSVSIRPRGIDVTEVSMTLRKSR